MKVELERKLLNLTGFVLTLSHAIVLPMFNCKMVQLRNARIQCRSDCVCTVLHIRNAELLHTLNQLKYWITKFIYNYSLYTIYRHQHNSMIISLHLMCFSRSALVFIMIMLQTSDAAYRYTQWYTMWLQLRLMFMQQTNAILHYISL